MGSRIHGYFFSGSSGQNVGQIRFDALVHRSPAWRSSTINPTAYFAGGVGPPKRRALDIWSNDDRGGGRKADQVHPGQSLWPPGWNHDSACLPARLTGRRTGCLRWEQVDFRTAALHVRRVKLGMPSTHPILGDELRALRRLRRRAGAQVALRVYVRPRRAIYDGGLRQNDRASWQGCQIVVQGTSHMLRHACGPAAAGVVNAAFRAIRRAAQRNQGRFGHSPSRMLAPNSSIYTLQQAISRCQLPPGSHLVPSKPDDAARGKIRFRKS
jgi:hypothetical protein